MWLVCHLCVMQDAGRQRVAAGWISGLTHAHSPFPGNVTVNSCIVARYAADTEVGDCMEIRTPSPWTRTRQVPSATPHRGVKSRYAHCVLLNPFHPVLFSRQPYTGQIVRC